jgi:hypothetical protein
MEATEALECLNKEMTRLLFSPDFFGPEKWWSAKIFLNCCSRTPSKLYFNTRQLDGDFTDAEWFFIYKGIATISEILLLEAEKNRRAIIQQFESAAFFRDLENEKKENMANAILPIGTIPFFTIEKGVVKFKSIGNYIVELKIKEKLNH